MQTADFTIFDHLSDPVFVLGAGSSNRPVYVFLNAVALAHLGTSLDDVQGRPAHEIFSGRAAYSVYRQQCHAWAAAEDTEYEIALPVRDKTLWVRTRLKAVKDPAGVLQYMVGTSQDITAQREMAQAQTMANAAAREMEDLVCLAAHDLRSPIGNLKTLAEVMRRDFVDHGDGKIELLNMIDSIADNALTVVSDIMAHALAANTSEKPAWFDFGALCDNVMVLLDPMRKHSARFPRVQVQADYTVVQIILRNLIDNAIKYAGKPEVRIAIDVTAMNAQRLMFSVRDDGLGFGDVAENAYGDVPGPLESQGGFGLVGVRRLARSRGGRVTVEQREVGAEVRFELPGKVGAGAPLLPAADLRAPLDQAASPV
ncbi:PAS domain-containing sensor histidine kinase [uncultured Tateyamaria sp.]|uniref:PAS domain-containing sensor histidine kinase n=1 Tax=uncultured Tateyamaria sp. TaxID=455651 RepID=UPI00262B15FA|nr:PAS domain-containing sensor histidine kinase [uncultured Tateyamaria sp.]